MYKEAILAGGCFWGELVWGTSARSFEVDSTVKENMPKRYTASVRSKELYNLYV